MSKRMAGGTVIGLGTKPRTIIALLGHHAVRSSHNAIPIYNSRYEKRPGEMGFFFVLFALLISCGSASYNWNELKGAATEHEIRANG